MWARVVVTLAGKDSFQYFIFIVYIYFIFI